MSDNVWVKGDRIVHSTRPEWGHGHVLTVEKSTHEGKPCQRLTIRFERAGTKTLSTAFAELKPANAAFHGAVMDFDAPIEDAKPVSALRMVDQNRESSFGSQRESAGGSLALDPKSLAELMTKLPEEVRDAFLPLRKRMAATLALYRFSESGGALLDWAAAQTGMKDPLSRFSRHELEQWFQRFRMEVDAHLRKLARELRKQEPGAIDELYNASSPAGKQAMRRADFGRT